ncbi:hypothetical protein GH714_033781 [Hevea brasiliensis]|uniref:Uncharacterized protein n=1 Tax=Hevea brasiliensis TaxID=3981 RepID=A0A6A6LQ15_HEVBR|nr:hypothetical protein GH714_033781 [Hevea brasiliensis]
MLREGIDAFDASCGQSFKMHATLLWIINDFLAYANLLSHHRWLEQGHLFRFQKKQFDGTEEFGSPPMSTSGTDVLRQLNGVDFTYGKFSKTSRKRTRDEVMEETTNVHKEMMLDDANDFIEIGQMLHDDATIKASVNVLPISKKKSIFFDLPYWEHNILRHNLDVMHIEQNVCDNLIGTLLNLNGKSKDNLKA